MLESLSLEIFGAFSSVLIALLWMVKYFKDQYMESERERKELQEEVQADKEEQLKVLQSVNSVLEAQLEKEQEQSKD